MPILVTALSFANALVSEPWTRYFVLVGGLALSDVVGKLSGVYFVEDLVTYVVVNVFMLQGFSINPIFGFSPLLMLAVASPLIGIMIQMLTQR